MLLEQKVVFLTGAANSIGRECTLACAREEASVVLADIDFDQARQTAAGLGPTAMAVECDVADGPLVERAVAAALASFGRIDAIHNNAGIGSPTPRARAQ